MYSEKRKAARYKEIGHVEAPEICGLSGVLEDISLTGIKVHFPCPVVLDDSIEYSMQLKMSQKPKMEALNIKAVMQWSKVDDQQTTFGFKITRTDQEKLLGEYIDFLKKNQTSDSDVQDVVPIKGPTFIK